MDAQGAAMVALVDQTQAALSRTGADSAEAIAKRVDDVTEKLEAMGALLASQSEMTATLLSNVRENLDGIDGRLLGGIGRVAAALDQHTERSDQDGLRGNIVAHPRLLKFISAAPCRYAARRRRGGPLRHRL